VQNKIAEKTAIFFSKNGLASNQLLVEPWLGKTKNRPEHIKLIISYLNTF